MLWLPLFLFESDEPVEDHRVLQYFEGRELHVCLVVPQLVGVDGGGGGGGVAAGVPGPMVQSDGEEESEEEVTRADHPVRLIPACYSPEAGGWGQYYRLHYSVLSPVKTNNTDFIP